MPFLGSTPATGYTTLVKQDLTPDGSSAAFTLTIPSTTEGTEVFVNNVRQEPGSAYNVNGTTLTFTSTPANTDSIYVVFQGGVRESTTIPVANSITTSMLVDGSITAAKIANGTVVESEIANGAVTSAKLSYPLTTFSSTGIDDNATGTVLVIDSSNNVLIQQPMPILELTSQTPDATLGDIGDKGAKVLFKQDSSTAGQGTEIVWAGNADEGGERWAAISGSIRENSVDGCAGDLQFSTKELVTANTMSERMRICANGNIGINSSEPKGALSVVGTTIIATGDNSTSGISLSSNATAGYVATITHTDLGIEHDSGSASRAFSFLSGYVGIGTTQPYTPLTVTYNSNRTYSGTGKRLTQFHSGVADNADQPGISLGYDTAGAGIIAGQTNAQGQPIAFWTYDGSAWAERLRIAKDGRLLQKQTTLPSADSVAAVFDAGSAHDSTYIQLHNSTDNTGGLIGTNSDAGITFYNYSGAVGSETYGNVSLTITPNQEIDLRTSHKWGVALDNYLDSAFNAYYSGGWKSRRGGPASLMRQHGGTGRVSSIDFYTSSEATTHAADAAINLVQRLEIANDGKINIMGGIAPTSGLMGEAYLNIGYTAGETRAIDIAGGWATNESKSITFTYSSGIVGQINSKYDNPGASLNFGKLYHGATGTTYTMKLESTSLTTADLTVEGSISATGELHIHGTPGCGTAGVTAIANTFATSARSRNTLSFVNDRITVPVAGLYLIDFNTIATNGSGRIDSTIRINGSGYQNMMGEGSGYRYRSGSIVVQLAANDYIQFYHQAWYVAGGSFDGWQTASVTKIA